MISLILSLFLSVLVTYVQGSPRTENGHTTSVLHCLAEYSVQYSVVESTDWTALSTPYNLRLVYTPFVITIPETTQQVSDSINCAAADNLKIQAKGGGHSYASYSSGGQNGSMVIDMKNFATVEVDNSTFIAKIGAGQRLGNVALGIYDQGERALPHGTCPGVGIAGHALHGGYGYASRKWGLALDHIVALDVVLANGTQLHVNASSYPDIFYAMRGAGDSIAIATYFYMQTEAAPTSVLHFEAGLTASLESIDIVAPAFEKLQEFVTTSPIITPNITLGMYTDSGGSFSISGWCMDCDLQDFQSNVFPALLAPFTSASKPTVTQQNWTAALLNLAAPETSLQQPLGSEYTSHDTFYAKSLVSKNMEPLSTTAIRAFWTYIIDNQGRGPFYSIINLYGGPGSAINTPSRDSSAYSDRDALWVFQNFGHTSDNLPPYNPDITPIIDGLNNAIPAAQPSGNFTAYINYVDPSLDATAAAQEYYGKETYARLVGIKMDVDPGFVFWNPQTIGNSDGL